MASDKPLRLFGCTGTWIRTEGPGEWGWKMYNRLYNLEIKPIRGYQTEEKAEQAMRRKARRMNIELEATDAK